jgi:hypothetical protein
LDRESAGIQSVRSFEVKTMTALSTTSFRPRAAGVCLAALLITSANAAPALCEADRPSAAAAPEVVRMLTARGLNAFAAEDPARPGHFVAVLAFPGAQLLAVSGETTSAEFLRWQIAERQYAGAYATLQSTAVPATKLFVHDMGCDGLEGAGGQVDVVYESGRTQTLIDGSGKGSRLSKGDYALKFTAAEVQYGAMLTLILQRLRTSGEFAGAEFPAVRSRGVRRGGPV